MRVRFAGGRFDSHSIPFEVLSDLATYRNLIVEVAKMLFKQRHGNRVRVPKGFGDSFQIGLSQVQGGKSAVAVAHRIPVAAPASDQQSMLFSTHQEFDDAQAYVEDLIRRVSSTGYVPNDFPTELAGRFNPFGQSLQDNEYVELSHGASPPVRYDTFIRKKIVLSREKTYENSVNALFTLNGGVLDTGTIHVRDESGASLDFRPLTDSEFEKAMERAPNVVQLVGSGLYDGEEKLRRLVEVSVIFDDDQPRLPFEDRLDEIATAEEGWFEEGNPAPSMAAVEAMRQFITLIIQDGMPAPYIYPTPDGGVAAEWSNGDWEASANIGIGGDSIEFHAINAQSLKELRNIYKLTSSDITAKFKGFLAVQNTELGETDASK
jgi:hypothetical protein